MKKTAAAVILLLLVLLGVRQAGRSRTWQLFGEIVPRVETEQKVVALTFDDGPRSGPLDALLGSLGGARATFFVCGAEMRNNPGAAEKLLAAGHELGNHSWSHERMWFKLPSWVAREIESTDALIRRAGQRGPILFRAPYGKKLAVLPWYLSSHGRVHVTWDVEPESYPDVDANAARIEAHVLERVRPGSIILLHPWYPGRENTRAAVPGIVKGLRARGFELVTVSELLKLRKT